MHTKLNIKNTRGKICVLVYFVVIKSALNDSNKTFNKTLSTKVTE
jgi:hypothetical protein